MGSEIAMSDRSFDDRFVAFVDILGFRNLVAKMEEDRELFEMVRDALKTIRGQAQRFREYRVKLAQSHKAIIANGKGPLTPTSDLQMTAFSDCYVISDNSSAWHVLAGVQALGSNMLARGIVCRGAVVHGFAYHRHGVLFGPAVIDAYLLESRVAKYPRILVTEAVRKAAWGYHQGIWKNRLFIQDTDGCWFVNIFTPSMSKWDVLSASRAESNSRRFLQNVRQWLNRELSKIRHDLGKRSKLHWLANHFNRVAAELGSIDPVELDD